MVSAGTWLTGNQEQFLNSPISFLASDSGQSQEMITSSEGRKLLQLVELSSDLKWLCTRAFAYQLWSVDIANLTHCERIPVLVFLWMTFLFCHCTLNYTWFPWAFIYLLCYSVIVNICRHCGGKIFRNLRAWNVINPLISLVCLLLFKTALILIQLLTVRTKKGDALLKQSVKELHLDCQDTAWVFWRVPEKNSMKDSVKGL